MGVNLLKAHNFYFKKFLPAVAPYLIVSPTECSMDVTKSLRYSLVGCKERNGAFKDPDCNKQVNGHLSTSAIPDKQEVDIGKQGYNKNGNDEQSSTEKLEPKSSDTQEMVKEKPLYGSTKRRQDSEQSASSSTSLILQYNADKQELKCTEQFDSDIQLVEASTNPRPVLLKTVLGSLCLAGHQVKGDGSCLYHAVAHQAKLIPTFSTGDEVVSRHLRRLTLLTMLNYPAVQLESNLSQQAWLAKQQQILNKNEWGGDLELRLMAIGLKQSIVFITDSTVSVFAHKFPQEPPPVSKMKGGIFIPVTAHELCASDNVAKDSLIIVYNGSNHYYSTLPCEIVS